MATEPRMVGLQGGIALVACQLEVPHMTIKVILGQISIVWKKIVYRDFKTRLKKRNWRGE